MKERPILMSAPMVRAILDGCKTQTRRIVKPQPNSGPNGKMVDLGDGFGLLDGCLSGLWRCPYGQPGDRLWVRETWKPTGIFAYSKPSETRACGRFAYGADTEQLQRDNSIRWRPSIHMPRWVSRIDLEITGVRVERLQDILENDVDREGITVLRPSGASVDDFKDLWESINGPGSWDTNPWVWVVEFRRIRP